MISYLGSYLGLLLVRLNQGLLTPPVQGSMLDKHKIQLQLSKHGATGAAAAKKASKSAKSDGGKAAGTKLVVRNVAFEATRKDLMGLFGPFGHIKSCRCANGLIKVAVLALIGT